MISNNSFLHAWYLPRPHKAFLRDHPYITSPYWLGGWVQKMASFTDVQYCIYADIVGMWVQRSPKNIWMVAYRKQSVKLKVITSKTRYYIITTKIAPKLKNIQKRSKKTGLFWHFFSIFEVCVFGGQKLNNFICKKNLIVAPEAPRGASIVEWMIFQSIRPLWPGRTWMYKN